MAQIKAQVTQELVDYLARHSRQDDVVDRRTEGAGDRDLHGLRGDLDRPRPR